MVTKMKSNFFATKSMTASKRRDPESKRVDLKREGGGNTSGRLRQEQDDERGDRGRGHWRERLCVWGGGREQGGEHRWGGGRRRGHRLNPRGVVG